jgi:chromate reductase
MKQYTIAVIIGSLRKDSINRQFTEAFLKLAPADFSFNRVKIGNLPFYNQDEEGNPSKAVLEFKEEIQKTDGAIFVTPEYNRSIPGVLKNALDIGSRPYGKSVWAGKPAGVLGVSNGSIGTAVAQQHLRNILAFLDMPTLAQPEGFIQMKEGLIDSQGNIGEASRQFLQNWMDRYTAWVKKFAQ